MRQQKLKFCVAVDVARKRTLLLKAMSAKHTGKSNFTGNGYRRQIAGEKCLCGYKQTIEQNQLFKI
jgi:hypothetical protein